MAEKTVLLDLTPAERDRWPKRAAELALRYGDLAAGLAGALEEIARDRREGGAHG